MNFGDTVNGLFEAFGALFTWRNALQLHRDKEIKGVYWPITAFFACWGLWNLWYYPSLGQWLSFWAGCLLVLGNICWVAQAVGLWLKKRSRARLESDRKGTMHCPVCGLASPHRHITQEIEEWNAKRLAWALGTGEGNACAKCEGPNHYPHECPTDAQYIEAANMRAFLRRGEGVSTAETIELLIAQHKKDDARIEQLEARCPRGCGAIPPDAGLHHLDDCPDYARGH